MKIKTHIVATVCICVVLIIAINCEDALAYRDPSLRGNDNPMDTRDQYEKKSESAGPLSSKTLWQPSSNGIIQNDLPADSGSATDSSIVGTDRR